MASLFCILFPLLLTIPHPPYNKPNQTSSRFSELFNLSENDPTISAVEKAQKRASLLLEVTAVTTSTNSVVTTFSNGTLFPSLGSERMDSVGNNNSSST